MCNPIRLSKIFVFMFMLNIGFSLLQAQDMPYETVTLNGQTYYKYTVKPGEGLYGISKTFSVSVAEILRHNPGSNSGLKNGQELLIPFTGEKAERSPSDAASLSVSQSSPVDQNSTFKHTVVKGETVYSLSKMYHTTVNEISRYNPGASDGIFEVRFSPFLKDV